MQHRALMSRTAYRNVAAARWSALSFALSFALLTTLAPTPAGALETPAGKVVLTLSGAVVNTNDNGSASFDMALLQQLPQHSFTTRTPWYPQPRKFSGVLMSTLLAAVGAAPGVTIKAVALNDYRVDMPADELTRDGAMLAYLLDDKPMTVREKGPLVIIFPFDDRPELRTPIHYSRAIWQLRTFELK